MLGGSRIYVFARDRVAIAEEHLRWQGWGDDVHPEACMDDVIQKKQRQLADEPSKRKRGRAPAHHAKLRTLTGNSECLPDAGSLVIPLIYLLNCGLFAEDLRPADLPELNIDGGSVEGHHILIDPNMSQSELRDMERHLRRHANVPTDSEDEGHDGVAEDGQSD